MEDRFKIRAWDKQYRRMAPIMEMHFTKGGILVKLINGQCDFLYDFSDNFILMQCTGLKDRKGELIYEGDIIERAMQENKVIIEKVQWDDGAFWAIDVDDHDILLGTSEAMNSVVIGNIYENPEELWQILWNKLRPIEEK